MYFCVLKTRNKTILFLSFFRGYSFWIWYFLVVFFFRGRSKQNFMFKRKGWTRKQRLDVFVCVNYNFNTTQRKPRETDTNLGAEMNGKTLNVEKLRKVSRVFSKVFLYYLVWKSAHFLCFFFIYASGCLIFL